MSYSIFDDIAKVQVTDTLLLAKEGDENALLVLLERCEPLINKFAKLPDGSIDEDLKQLLYMTWLKAVETFDPSRYYKENPEETSQP